MLNCINSHVTYLNIHSNYGASGNTFYKLIFHLTINCQTLIIQGWHIWMVCVHLRVIRWWKISSIP